MGTRSVVALRDSENPNAWKGRYVHWDGYPDGVGDAVRTIVQRDGIAKAVATLLLNNYGWSTVDGEQEQRTLDNGYDDGRFVAVPGYGIAYTTHAGQSSPDEWHTQDLLLDPDSIYIEWVHVIEPDGSVTSIENTA